MRNSWRAPEGRRPSEPPRHFLDTSQTLPRAGGEEAVRAPSTMMSSQQRTLYLAPGKMQGGVWEVSGRCLGGVWEVSGRCLGSV